MCIDLTCKYFIIIVTSLRRIYYNGFYHVNTPCFHDISFDVHITNRIVSDHNLWAFEVPDGQFDCTLTAMMGLQAIVHLVESHEDTRPFCRCTETFLHASELSVTLKREKTNTLISLKVLLMFLIFHLLLC